MSNKSPVFPIIEPQHFSDYGFDPQIDYFQILEEARRHKRETIPSAIDTLHFKLQKPVTKDDRQSRTAGKDGKKKWWRRAMNFFKFKLSHKQKYDNREDVHEARARAFRASMSGPVLSSQSFGRSLMPCRTSSHQHSGPITGDVPHYLSLRELSRQQQDRISSPLPSQFLTSSIT